MGKIAITFDTDHMSQDGLAYFLEAVLPKNITATFFCYQPFACLRGTAHEVAAHPYLAGSSDWLSTAKHLIHQIEDDNQCEIKGLRPHSLMSSQNFIVQLNSIGLKYVSSISAHPDLDTDAFRYPWGPVEIPIRYMDNMDLWARDKAQQPVHCFSKSHIKNAVSCEGLYCFDFHPIHILLNTSVFNDYENWTREGRPELKSCVVGTGYGVRDFFLDVCDAIISAEQTVHLCKDIAQLRAV